MSASHETAITGVNNLALPLFINIFENISIDFADVLVGSQGLALEVCFRVSEGQHSGSY
jgi:hypothetical protein